MQKSRRVSITEAAKFFFEVCNPWASAVIRHYDYWRVRVGSGAGSEGASVPCTQFPPLAALMTGRDADQDYIEII